MSIANIAKIANIANTNPNGVTHEAVARVNRL
jgi:hypothetical protein